MAAENVPLAYVVLVVEGTLRVSGRDALGQPFTLRRIHAGEWWGLWSGLSGVASATCRSTENTKVLAVPLSIWQGWWKKFPALAEWIESHPQREDLYAALRPILAERPRQDRTFLDEIDQLQVVLRTAQISDSQDLQELKTNGDGISWLIPSVSHFLPGLEPVGVDGLSIESLKRVLQSSAYGMRLVGYPTEVLQDVFDRRDTPSPLEPETASDVFTHDSDEGVVEALPEWQNPDGEALLAAALRQEEGRPPRDDEGLRVTPIFGQSGVEQGLALLQMICETLRVPSAVMLLIECSKEWWELSHPPLWRILVKLQMGLRSMQF